MNLQSASPLVQPRSSWCEAQQQLRRWKYALNLGAGGGGSNHGSGASMLTGEEYWAFAVPASSASPPMSANNPLRSEKAMRNLLWRIHAEIRALENIGAIDEAGWGRKAAAGARGSLPHRDVATVAGVPTI
jgi:hypothetical protein